MFRIYYILTYPITFLCLCLLWVYRKILTHGLGKNCHYIPTCSKYAWDSFIEFGFLFGGILTLKRLLRCNPKHKGGVDFVKLNLLGNYKWKC